MPFTVEQRVSALENRFNAIQQQLAQLVEAINQCVTIDQVQQFEVVNGIQIDALTNEVETLGEQVSLLRDQQFVTG